MRKFILAFLAAVGLAAGVVAPAHACGGNNCYSGGDSNNQNSSSSNAP